MAHKSRIGDGCTRPLWSKSQSTSEAGFHLRRSRSRSRNQKRRAIRSSENQTDGPEAEHRFCLWHRRLQSSENCIVAGGSGSGRINQSQCSIPGPQKYKFLRQRQHGGRRAACALALINHYFAQAETIQEQYRSKKKAILGSWYLSTSSSFGRVC